MNPVGHDNFIFLFLHDQRTHGQNRFWPYILRVLYGQTDKKSAVSDFCPFFMIFERYRGDFETKYKNTRTKSFCFFVFLFFVFIKQVIDRPNTS